MKGYIITVICVSIIGSLVSLLSPDGESGGLGRNTRQIFGLCVIIICIIPIKDMINGINELNIELVGDAIEGESDRYEELFNEAYGEAELKNLKNGIKQMLLDKFDIDMSENDVSVALSESGNIDRISITLYGSAVFKDTGAIEDYLSQLFDCEIISIIG